MSEMLNAEFKTAAGFGLSSSAGTMAPIKIWGRSVSEILQLVCEKALELGRECRPEIEEAARKAVDLVVALDLPFVPEGLELVIDEATRNLGYTAITSILDAILAEPA
jgi:hypothetical protein